MCGSTAGRKSRCLRFSFFFPVVRRSANSRTLGYAWACSAGQDARLYGRGDARRYAVKHLRRCLIAPCLRAGDGPPCLFQQFAKTLALAGLFDYSSSMRIGSLELKSNLFLSPLAGYTNLPFRLTLRGVGGLDLATTDLVNARS